MKILETRVMKGPNYWSIRRHKLVVMRLDLEDLEEKPCNAIPGFREQLEKHIPSLWNTVAAEEEKGGFFKRVEERYLDGPCGRACGTGITNPGWSGYRLAAPAEPAKKGSIMWSILPGRDRHLCRAGGIDFCQRW